ncbi:MAG TPA: hypothetical protein VFO18_08775 [Methylomirabilota bacterium]|nr:hypothetical protein [Methylomirabilota bacterium]
MREDPPSGTGPAGAGESPRDKGFRSRKREDHALLLIEELKASLGDLAKVKRILLELGRFYDPVVGGAIVGIEEAKRIVALLERGCQAEAAALVQERYELYIKDRAHLGRRDEA